MTRQKASKHHWSALGLRNCICTHGHWLALGLRHSTLCTLPLVCAWFAQVYLLCTVLVVLLGCCSVFSPVYCPGVPLAFRLCIHCVQTTRLKMMRNTVLRMMRSTLKRGPPRKHQRTIGLRLVCTFFALGLRHYILYTCFLVCAWSVPLPASCTRGVCPCLSLTTCQILI